MSLFSGDLFSGDDAGDGLAGLEGLEPFEMGNEATDGDLALILWTMNAIEPSMVNAGPAAVMKGLRQLATRRGIDPNAAVQIQNNRYMLDDRIMTEVRAAQAAANTLTAAQRSQLQAQLAAARSGGAMMPMPGPQGNQGSALTEGAPMPWLQDQPRPAGQPGQLLQTGARSNAPRWIPYALLAGGVAIAGGLVWVASRRPKTATANRRRARRRRTS